MPRLSFPLLFVLVLASCSRTPVPAHVASTPAPPAPVEAVAASLEDAGFELTLDRVERFFAALPALAAVAESDPSLDPAIDASEEDLDRYAARLQDTPALRAAIEASGLSTREYALTSAHLMGALMAQGALDSGLLATLPEGIPQRDVDFVRTHKARIAALSAPPGR